jgi:hypothetical protein
VFVIVTVSVGIIAPIVVMVIVIANVAEIVLETLFVNVFAIVSVLPTVSRLNAMKIARGLTVRITAIVTAFVIVRVDKITVNKGEK